MEKINFNKIMTNNEYAINILKKYIDCDLQYSLFYDVEDDEWFIDTTEDGYGLEVYKFDKKYPYDESIKKIRYSMFFMLLKKNIVSVIIIVIITVIVIVILWYLWYEVYSILPKNFSLYNIFVNFCSWFFRI